MKPHSHLIATKHLSLELHQAFGNSIPHGSWASNSGSAMEVASLRKHRNRYTASLAKRRKQSARHDLARTYGASISRAASDADAVSGVCSARKRERWFQMPRTQRLNHVTGRMGRRRKRAEIWRGAGVRNHSSSTPDQREDPKQYGAKRPCVAGSS